MKFTLDTDNIKFPSFKDFSDREVFFISLTIILSAYMLSDWLDARKYVSVDTRLGRVEATLERVVNSLNGDSSDVMDPKSDRIYNLPKSKYTALINTGKKISLTDKEFDCLSRNIYWEAKTEPLVGQIAVAHVTYNRVMSGKWGDNFCSVVFARKQFSWTNFKHIRNAQPKSKKEWIRAKHSAILFTNGVRVNNLDNSMFYYADYIKKPKWDFTKLIKDDHIGQHIFYASTE